ncbi:hypothetical protein [Tenacibaculum salmonis]|uniref:hypothetical protein n=1 Tax=Tenacibaculum sp. P3-BQ1 TaxID=3232310 RepID=UPI0034DE831B
MKNLLLGSLLVLTSLTFANEKKDTKVEKKEIVKNIIKETKDNNVKPFCYFWKRRSSVGYKGTRIITMVTNCITGETRMY